MGHTSQLTSCKLRVAGEERAPLGSKTVTGTIGSRNRISWLPPYLSNMFILLLFVSARLLELPVPPIGSELRVLRVEAGEQLSGRISQWQNTPPALGVATAPRGWGVS